MALGVAPLGLAVREALLLEPVYDGTGLALGERAAVLSIVAAAGSVALGSLHGNALGRVDVRQTGGHARRHDLHAVARSCLTSVLLLLLAVLFRRPKDLAVDAEHAVEDLDLFRGHFGDLLLALAEVALGLALLVAHGHVGLDDVPHVAELPEGTHGDAAHAGICLREGLGLIRLAVLQQLVLHLAKGILHAVVSLGAGGKVVVLERKLLQPVAHGLPALDKVLEASEVLGPEAHEVLVGDECQHGKEIAPGVGVARGHLAFLAICLLDVAHARPVELAQHQRRQVHHVGIAILLCRKDETKRTQLWDAARTALTYSKMKFL